MLSSLSGADMDIVRDAVASVEAEMSAPTTTTPDDSQAAAVDASNAAGAATPATVPPVDAAVLLEGQGADGGEREADGTGGEDEDAQAIGNDTDDTDDTDDDVSGDAKAAADSEAETPPEADFAELLDDIPSKEVILRTHQRIPEATKNALVEFADKARNYRDALNRIGGEDGVNVLEPIHKVLTVATPTVEDQVSALAAALDTNEGAALGLFTAGAELLFNRNNAPEGRRAAVVGDAVLQRRFGEGVTADKIERYVALEQAGAFDSEQDIDMVDGVFIQDRQAQAIDALMQEVARLKQEAANPHSQAKAQAAGETAVVQLNADIAAKLGEAVNPIRDAAQWKPETRIHGILMNAIIADLKNEPEYKQIVELTRANGGRIGTANGTDGEAQMSHAVNIHLTRLVNKAKAHYARDVAAITRDIASLATAAARQAPAVTTAAATAASNGNAKGTKAANAAKPKAVGQTDNEFRRTMRDLFGDSIADIPLP